jgi:asparagine synthase (glutamine-hydrolysing)
MWNVTADRPRARVGAMLDAVRHRGPDGRGTLEYPGGSAGMVRLALVDLSDRGQQPIWSADRRTAILFNGEMYNFREERARLEKLGHKFQTATDTEVLLNLYLEHGLAFHEHVRGMYTLAIFDWRKTRPDGMPELVLARGPLGIKPLYVAHPDGDPQWVIFSSEVRAILASGLVEPRLDADAVSDYLALGFVLQPGTLISGVRMLEPGTLEQYSPGAPVLHKRYWHVPAYEPRQETLDDAAARLRATVEESVRLHAWADAPIGAFLSGGVDSTAIVSLMRKHVSELRTYTVRFPEFPGQDEDVFAAEVARSLGCIHTSVEVTSREVAELMPRIAGDLDQPSNDGLNTWLVSRAAARDVKGVLSGVGGDEWFAGYRVTRRMARYATMRFAGVQAAAATVANWSCPWIPQGRFRSRLENLATRRHALATWLQSHTVFHPRLARQMAGLDRGLQTLEQKAAAVIAPDCDDWRRETPVGLACLLDARLYMIHQLLRDSDATSMAHSLELRVPLVDLELVSFSRSCADEYKLTPGGGSGDLYGRSGAKRVLIHALKDLLPPTIGERPKRGFSLPYVEWMQGKLAPLVEDVCSDANVKRRGLIDPGVVSEVRIRAAAGDHGFAYPKLWTLMMFELWCRAVLDVDRNQAVERFAASAK